MRWWWAAAVCGGLRCVGSWVDTHERDASILRISVEPGESYVARSREVAELCQVDIGETLAGTFRERYKFTVSGEIAPYRMEILVSVDDCFAQEITMATSRWQHSFGLLWFDSEDDVEALGVAECERIMLPGDDVSGCADAVSRRMREVLRSRVATPCRSGCPAAVERRRAAAVRERVAAAVAAVDALDGDDHAASVGRVFDRIGGQILQNLLQHPGITLYGQFHG